MMNQFVAYLSKYFSPLSLHGLNVRWQDIVEIIIISFLVYQIMFWLKNRKPSQWRDIKEINANLQDGFVNLDFSGIVAKVGDGNHLEVEVDANSTGKES